jgi:hypothetical protein
MFPLHYTTRRFFCRTGFLLLCLVPTAAVLAWALWLATPAHVDACRVELERQLQLAVKLASVNHPEPGVSIFEGLELLRPRSRQRLAYLPRLEVIERGGKRLLIATGPEIEQLGLAYLQQKHDAMLGGGQNTFLAASLIARISGAEHQLKDIRIVASQTTAGEELHGQCRTADGPIKLHVLAAPGEKSTTRWEFDTGGAPLACLLVSESVPWLKHLGDQATFEGSLAITSDENGISGELRGRLVEIDLARAIAGNFPHRLDGSAELIIERARISQNRLVEIAGQLRGGPGLISPSLRIAAAEAMELLASEAALHPDSLLEYEELACEFKLNAAGLKLLGRCSQAPPGAILIDRRQMLLGEPRRQPLPVAALVRTLVPPSSSWVPASRQSGWLLGVLPLSDDP